MDKPKKQIVIVKSLIVDDGKVLLVRRRREWHKESHDKWEFPGGKIDFGETPEEAAVREAKEESGYDVKILQLLPKIISAQWEYEDRMSQQILICYVCKKISGDPILGDHGVSEIRWFSKEDALGLECLPGTKEFLVTFFPE